MIYLTPEQGGTDNNPPSSRYVHNYNIIILFTIPRCRYLNFYGKGDSLPVWCAPPHTIGPPPPTLYTPEPLAYLCNVCVVCVIITPYMFCCSCGSVRCITCKCLSQDSAFVSNVPHTYFVVVVVLLGV